MKKSIVIGMFILSIGFNTGILAESNERTLAVEYLELSKTKETFDATIEAYVEQISASQPGSNKDEIRAMFQSLMGWDVLKEPTIDIVISHFTAEELKAINEFYKTKIGKIYAEKSPAMAVDISNFIGKNMKKAFASPKK